MEAYKRIKYQFVLMTIKTAGMARISALTTQKDEFASLRILPISAFAAATMPSIQAAIAKMAAINPLM